MTSSPVTDAPTMSSSLPMTRTYQQEMLEASLQRNVVAMDTGSERHIAILRIKYELEREPKKVCCFVNLQKLH